MTDYRATCPKRTVTEVHHTTRTWLPVTLSCGHIERINWTAHVGDTIGCLTCAECPPLEAPAAEKYAVLHDTQGLVGENLSYEEGNKLVSSYTAYYSRLIRQEHADTYRNVVCGPVPGSERQGEMLDMFRAEY